MQKQYLITKGWRTVIRILCAALIGTLAIGSAGQIAQAAPAAGDPIPVKSEYQSSTHSQTLPAIS